MKYILSSCFCIIVYMQVSSQNDITIIKDSSQSLPIQKKTIKDLPPFSYHMLCLTNCQIPLAVFYSLRNYQNAHSGLFMKNKWETAYEFVGYTLLSSFAENSGYIYDSYAPDNKLQEGYKNE